MSKLRLLATVSHLALAVAEFYVRRDRERAGWYSSTFTAAPDARGVVSVRVPHFRGAGFTPWPVDNSWPA